MRVRPVLEQLPYAFISVGLAGAFLFLLVFPIPLLIVSYDVSSHVSFIGNIKSSSKKHHKQPFIPLVWDVAQRDFSPLRPSRPRVEWEDLGAVAASFALSAFVAR